MDCRKFEEQISDYLDGLLPKGETRNFAAHLLQCRACRALTDEIKATLHEVKEEVDAPPTLENALFAIQAEQMPLTCQQFEGLITEFLDGFVPAALYHKFEAHTQSCQPCSNLLTEVVLAIAACHSVHAEEELPVSDVLYDRLLAIAPQRLASWQQRWAARASGFAAALLPRHTRSRRWNYATASGLAFATFAFLLLGVSDDGSVPGIYRQIRYRAATLYSQSADIFSQKEEVIASFERVRSNIGEVWSTLGGVSEADAARSAAPNPAAIQSSQPASTKPKP